MPCQPVRPLKPKAWWSFISFSCTELQIVVVGGSGKEEAFRKMTCRVRWTKNKVPMSRPSFVLRIESQFNASHLFSGDNLKAQFTEEEKKEDETKCKKQCRPGFFLCHPGRLSDCLPVFAKFPPIVKCILSKVPLLLWLAALQFNYLRAHRRRLVIIIFVPTARHYRVSSFSRENNFPFRPRTNCWNRKSIAHNEMRWGHLVRKRAKRQVFVPIGSHRNTYLWRGAGKLKWTAA